MRRGATSEALRRSLIEAHAQHLRHLEDIAPLPRHQRSQLLLQPRPTDSLLLLAGEGAGSDELQPLADLFFKRGFTVLCTSLAFRALDQSGSSPTFWQTCADEAENRYDMLAHYATRVGVVGVGMAGLLALHLAATRRVSEVVALYPTFGAEAGWLERLRATLRRVLMRDRRLPSGWAQQRQLAAHMAHENAAKLAVPLYVLVEDRRARSEAARSARIAQKLVHRAATRVHMLPPGETPSVRELPPALVDEILAFVRRH